MNRFESEQIHAYFTASSHYPADMKKAFEDGKQRYISTLQQRVKAIEGLTLQDYCMSTGAEL